MPNTFWSLPLFFEKFLPLCNIRCVMVLCNFNTYADGISNIPEVFFLVFCLPNYIFLQLSLRHSFLWLYTNFLWSPKNSIWSIFHWLLPSVFLAKSMWYPNSYYSLSSMVLMMYWSKFLPSLTPLCPYYLITLDPKAIIIITSLKISLTHLFLSGF